ncbi:NADP-dependent oxidoreductase [Terribacillus sp. DMT04]|uniref:NADP-dependent oxidoreductase n=1 Tax=Terribacillus sp. DMT04 TaxID=2850441 RepID=UPI001C2C5292|nr:NADP-dependent oxidoreductase [Terribacillus sp. DMT04]QXE01283.1 NADP-dependent oxidoreductase [Terribacillus sp. DMT04]
MAKNEEIQLAKRPEGMPTEENFRFVDTEVPELKEGQVLVKSIYISVDPYMRGRMSDAKSYVAPYEVDAPISGGVVGQVTASQSDKFQKGDYVLGNLSWARYNAANAETLQKVDPELGPVSTALGVLGMPGLTAYFGLTDIGEPKSGETVVVSGAAGAVGSTVVQIAKILGARVVGIAGSPKKLDYVKNTLGADEVINYKEEDVAEALEKACPNGIDVYFDNVGGPVSDAVYPLLNAHARIPLCGSISSYNKKEDQGPRIQGYLVKAKAKIQGFIVADYGEQFAEGKKQLSEWFKQDKLTFEENVVDGFENVPDAFLGLFKGENLGKQLVKVAEAE